MPKKRGRPPKKRPPAKNPPARSLSQPTAPLTLADIIDPKCGKIPVSALDDPAKLALLQARSGGPPCPWHKIPTMAYKTSHDTTYYGCQVDGCHASFPIRRDPPLALEPFPDPPGLPPARD